MQAQQYGSKHMNGFILMLQAVFVLPIHNKKVLFGL